MLIIVLIRNMTARKSIKRTLFMQKSCSLRRRFAYLTLVRREVLNAIKVCDWQTDEEVMFNGKMVLTPLLVGTELLQIV